MIPKVAGSGQSFDGAGEYYLHDKLEDQQRLSTDADRIGEYALHDKANRQTSFRVGFTEMLNMEAETPAQAIAQMSASYERFKERERNKRGRKLAKPVYAYSLAWAFDQAPSRDEMMSAALSSLKALDLENLQTLIVQHTDEPQPHIHIIVNRIELHGRNARNIYRDHLALSKWAEQYERDHGGIRCEQRVLNNERRGRGEFVRDTVSLTRSEYNARDRIRREERVLHVSANDVARMMKEATPALDMVYRHIAERRVIEARMVARVKSDRAIVDAKFAPKWRQLYRLQAVQLQILKAVNKGGIFERACFVMANREFLKKGGRLGVREIAKFALSSRALTKRVQRIHTLERSDLAAWHGKLADGAERLVYQNHREELVKLRTRQQVETDGLNYRLRTDFENRKRAHQQARSEAVRPEPQPEPASQADPGPDLRPGEGMRPDDVASYLHDTPPLRDRFQAAVEPPEELSPGDEISRRREQRRRKYPRRGMERGH